MWKHRLTHNYSFRKFFKSQGASPLQRMAKTRVGNGRSVSGRAGGNQIDRGVEMPPKYPSGPPMTLANMCGGAWPSWNSYQRNSA
jgi:hypothetical protein